MEADRQNLRDLNTFYSTCMDEDALDRRGSEPLVRVVQEVIDAWRGKSLLTTSDRQTEDRKTRLTETLLLLHSKGGYRNLAPVPLFYGLSC